MVSTLYRSTILLLLVTFFLVENEANARVIINENTQYYDVYGSTGVEIYRSMEANGPRHGGLKKEILASTNFKFAVKNIKSQIKGRRCIVSNVDIIVSVTYTYPRWRNPEAASSTTRSAWKNFMKYAILHEKEHVKITTKFAKDYEKALLKSRRSASSNCEKQSLSETFRTNIAIRRHERLHRMFDKKDLRPGGKAYDTLRILVQSR